MQANGHKMRLCHSELSHVSYQYSGLMLHPSRCPKGYLASDKEGQHLIAFQFQCLPYHQYEKNSREGIATMIEELSQRWWRFGPSCLLAINRIECRVCPHTESSQDEAIPRHVFLQRIIKSQYVCIREDDQQPAYECDEIWCDPHRHYFYCRLPEGIHSAIKPRGLTWVIFVILKSDQAFRSDKICHFMNNTNILFIVVEHNQQLRIRSLWLCLDLRALFQGKTVDPQELGDLVDCLGQEDQDDQKIHPEGSPKEWLFDSVEAGQITDHHEEGEENHWDDFLMEEWKAHLNEGIFTFVTEEVMTLQTMRLHSKPKLSRTIPLNWS